MWPQPILKVQSQGSGNTDIVPLFQDKEGKPLSVTSKEAYSHCIEKLRKLPKLNSIQFMRFGGEGGAENVLFVGLGSQADFNGEKARVAGGKAYAKLHSEKVEKFSVHLDSLKDLDLTQFSRAFAEGLLLPCYGFEKYKSKLGDSEKKYYGPTEISFVTQNQALKKSLEKELNEVSSLGIAVNLTRDWSNEPSNFGTPEFYASEASALAKKYGLKCRILDEKDAEKEKMGLFLGVGQGSEKEGRIVIVEYFPKKTTQKTIKKNIKKNIKTIALVGKGVTFDSGGISIKPAARMEDMKHDMTGAATMMGAVLLASLWGAPNHVIAVMAFTENMPDGNAINPGNVLTARSGKRVEIINTDAEGRLILADALDFAHDYKPDVIIDAATLTGAVSVALGKYCCAILGNDENLIQQIKAAGETQGERIWQLPLYDDYLEDLKSDVADLKNSANDSNGGTVRGAIFLKQFIQKGTAWAHLDIASTAYNLSHLSYYPKKGASGAYVRTLAKFVTEF